MRGLSGFVASSISTIAPLLMAIMLSPKKRGKAVMYYSLAMNGGITFAYIINLVISFMIDLYWIMFAITAVFSIVALCIIHIIIK